MLSLFHDLLFSRLTGFVVLDYRYRENSLVDWSVRKNLEQVMFKVLQFDLLKTVVLEKQLEHLKDEVRFDLLS